MLTCDTYLRPRSLDEAFDAMAAEHGRYRIVAGATDILPWAREGRAGDVHIPVMIDVTRIPELGARTIGDGRVQLGAATPIQRFLDDDALKRALPCMPRCAVWFADDQIRESATIGGNLVNGSPAADGTPPLLAHNAQVEIASRCDGKIVRRTLALEDFMTGPGQTVLREDEILVAINCEASPEHGACFEKVGHRRSLVISLACVAALVRLDPAGRNFADVRLAIGGVGPVPLRLREVEEFLRGAPVSDLVIEKAGAMPMHLVQSRTRQAYRREVLHGFVARALITATRAAGAAREILTPEMEAAYA
jgi:xanthine dehydrogenase FAD-binding subunit